MLPHMGIAVAKEGESVLRLRLKEIRELCGLSQQALADAIGEAQSSVGGWESGRGTPRYQTLLKIADYFDVSLDYLVGRSDVQTVAKRAKEEPALTDHERALIRRYRAISPVEQAMICKLLDLPQQYKNRPTQERSGGRGDSSIF
jgi:transcriptional regulator with XRE-family HTH domain